MSSPKLVGEVLAGTVKGPVFIAPEFRPDVVAPFLMFGEVDLQIAAELDADDPTGGAPEVRLVRDGEYFEPTGPGWGVVIALVAELRLDAFDFRKYLEQRREASADARAEAICSDRGRR